MQRGFLTVAQTAEQYSIPIGGLRALLFRRQENGLDHAVIRIGRKILIDRLKFERWLKEHSEVP